jgi:hypothetical protein
MPMGIYKRTKEQYRKICTPERARKISKKLKFLYKNGLRTQWTKGKNLSDAHKLKIKSTVPKGKDNANWKGDDVGYTALHDWVRRKLGSPKFCEHCKRSDRKKYEWANNDHKYRRNVKDYMRLCTACHRKYDYTSGLSNIDRFPAS